MIAYVAKFIPHLSTTAWLEEKRWHMTLTKGTTESIQCYLQELTSEKSLTILCEETRVGIVRWQYHNCMKGLRAAIIYKIRVVASTSRYSIARVPWLIAGEIKQHPDWATGHKTQIDDVSSKCAVCLVNWWKQPQEALPTHPIPTFAK